MTETTKLGLPLVQAAQAQKHVTINEALTRLDALVRLELMELEATAPPAVVTEGAGYALGPVPTGVWAGQGGAVAISLDGIWNFVNPAAGWQAWDRIAGVPLRYDGAAWSEEGVPTSTGGARTRQAVIEFDQDLSGAGAISTDVSIPSNSQVVGVSGRVISALGGSGLTGWRIGVASSDDRYGSGLGIWLNSWARGLTGQPVTYYADTPLIVTPEGAASFTEGTVRLAIHVIQIEPPRAV